QGKAHEATVDPNAGRVRPARIDPQPFCEFTYTLKGRIVADPVLPTMILPESPAVIPMVIDSAFVVAEAEMKLVCRYQLDRGGLCFYLCNSTSLVGGFPGLARYAHHLVTACLFV